MIESPFNLSEEDRIFYLRIVLFLLSLCIGGLIRLHAPPPRMIANEIIWVIFVIRLRFGAILLLCRRAVVLPVMFD